MFENFNNMLVENLGPLGPLYVVGGFGLILILATLPVFLKKRADAFDRLKAMAGDTAPKSSKLGLRQRGDSSDALERFAHFLEPKSEAELSATRMDLMRAGYTSKNAVRMLHFLKFVLGITGLVIGVALAMVKSSQGDVSTQTMLLYALLPGGVGYFMPSYWVKRRVQQRQAEIVSGFPDALDLMLVCVEAGQSIDQTINRVAKETKVGYPALAEEFEVVANETKAGKERITVLRDMADRVGVADISSFVTTLIQSATFGTPVSEALRVYSAEMRDKRIMRAEELANKLPTKLTLGTMLFTVPPLLVILIAPSIFGISKTLEMLNGM
jgi:tight adherence protein C